MRHCGINIGSFSIDSALGRAFRRSAALSISLIVGLLSGCGLMNGHVMNQSGMGYFKQGNYAQARSEFQRAVADDPHNADYLANLAAAMNKQGDNANAEWTYKHALNVDPGHQPSYHGLAQMLLDQGRQAEGEALLAAWVGTEPGSPSAHVELAWLQREQGQHAAAEQSLRHALVAEPNHPTALAHLGQLYHDTGRPQQAVALYQRALLADWHQPEVQSRLATLQDTTSRRAMVAAARTAQPQSIAARPMQYAPQTPQTAAYPQFLPMANAGMQPTYRQAYLPQQPLMPVPDSISAQSLAQSQFNADPAHAPQIAGAPAVAPF